jgi:hypothetical protein
MTSHTKTYKPAGLEQEKIYNVWQIQDDLILPPLFPLLSKEGI